MLDTHQKIDNIDLFNIQLKKDAIRTFLISYKDSVDFLAKYNDDLLTYKDIEFASKRFIILLDNEYYIDKEDVNLLIKELYNQLVFKVLSKLVDEGKLELCWDDERLDFIWRKKRRNRYK